MTFVGVGIDLVDLDRIRTLLANKGERAMARFFSEGERRYLASRPDATGHAAARIAAKEAVYKAWFPLVGEWLDHQQAEITFDPRDGTFVALLARDGLIVDGHQVRRLDGRWIRDRGILLTAVVLCST